MLQGVDSMAHYEQALRQVRYRNWRPANLSERRFRLTCSELNGRYTSNEFNLEVSLIYIHSYLPSVCLIFMVCLFYLSMLSCFVFYLFCIGQCSSPLGTCGARQSHGCPAPVHETRPSPTHDALAQLSHVR